METTSIGLDPSTAAPRRRRSARLGVIAAMLGGIIAAGGARYWAMSLQATADANGPNAVREGGGVRKGLETSSFASLDSYTMVLLMGGLRGPLVMYLWASSENQKNERDLEDFDTKVELIRQLQPEFDTVHVFQIWNKAYNISAQVPSLPNKYGIILDALEYGRNVSRDRPNNINILMSMNQVYQHKLGSSGQDSVYYRRRIRMDTRYRPPEPPTGVGLLRARMESMLDEGGNVRPDLVKVYDSRPANLPARVRLPADREPRLRKIMAELGIALPDDQVLRSGDGKTVAWTISESNAKKLMDRLNPDDPANTWATDVSVILADWNDGSELQYIKPYGPYRYGLGPLALGYNYSKRAQVLLNRTGQKPTQYSRSVIDSKPALELKGWGDEEFERGAEIEMRGLKAVGRPDFWHGGALDREALDEARDAFGLSARVYSDAVSEYARHLNRTDPTLRASDDEEMPNSEGSRMKRLYSYDSHVEELKARAFMSRADKHFLDAALESNPEKRRQSLYNARMFYAQAAYRAKYLELRYFTPGELLPRVFGPPTMPAIKPDFSRPDVDEFFAKPMPLLMAHARMMALLAIPSVRDKYDQNNADRLDTERIILRATARSRVIDNMLGQAVVTVGDDPFTADGTYAQQVRVTAPEANKLLVPTVPVVPNVPFGPKIGP